MENEFLLLIVNIFAGLVASIILAIITMRINKPTLSDKSIARLEKYIILNEKIKDREQNEKVEILIKQKLNAFYVSESNAYRTRFYTKTVFRIFLAGFGIVLWAYIFGLVEVDFSKNLFLSIIFKYGVFVPFIFFLFYYYYRIFMLASYILSKYKNMRGESPPGYIDPILEEIVIFHDKKEKWWVSLFKGLLSSCFLFVSYFICLFIVTFSSIIFNLFLPTIDTSYPLLEGIIVLTSPILNIVITVYYCLVIAKVIGKEGSYVATINKAETAEEDSSRSNMRNPEEKTNSEKLSPPEIY